VMICAQHGSHAVAATNLDNFSAQGDVVRGAACVVIEHDQCIDS
jgi:hypothetical protein